MKAKRVWRILNLRFKIYLDCPPWKLPRFHAATIVPLDITLYHFTASSISSQHIADIAPSKAIAKASASAAPNWFLWSTAWRLKKSVISVEIGRVPQQSAEYTNHLRSQNSGHPKGGEPQKSRKEGKEGTISRLGNWWNCALFRKSFSFRCLSIKSLESHGLIAVLLSSEKCSILSRKRFTWPSFVKEAAARNLTCEEWSHQRLVVSIVPASKLTI